MDHSTHAVPAIEPMPRGRPHEHWTPPERDAVAWLAGRRDDMVRTLSAWVAMPTGMRHAPGLIAQRAALVERLEQLGARTRLVAGAPAPTWLREGGGDLARGPVPDIVVCERRHPGAAHTLLLCGHIDTVHDPRDTEFASLVISPDGRKGVGPGCADMKGGLLVAVEALEACERAAPGELSWVFVIVPDEETGSFHSDAAMRAISREGFAAGLVFEPALPDGGLVIERPGSAQFLIECTGKAAHVGRDFSKGVSAVGALACAMTRALEIADPARGLLINIGPLEGGAATNVVPDKARAWGNARVFSPAAQQAVQERLRALESNHQRLPSTRVELLFNRPAKPATAGVRRLAAIARQAAADLGQDLPLGTTGGVCDGNNLQAQGLAVIDTLGVRGGGLHTNQEWIELDSLVERAQLTALVLLRLHAWGLSEVGASVEPGALSPAEPAEQSQGLFGDLGEGELVATDQRLVDAYVKAGRGLDDLPYTEEFEAMMRGLRARGDTRSEREVLHRLHNLRKRSRLPVMGRSPTPAIKVTPDEEATLRGLVEREVASLGQRDRLPYDPRMAVIVAEFNAATGRQLAAHDVWRLVCKIAK